MVTCVSVYLLVVIAAAGSSHTHAGVDKMVEKLSLLVILCDAIVPDVKVDDFLLNRIKDQHKLDVMKLSSSQSDTEEAVQLFKRLTPSFVSPAVWDQTLGRTLVEMQQPDAIKNRQLNLFAQDVGRLARVDQLLSFAKLYHNVSLTVTNTKLPMCVVWSQRTIQPFRNWPPLWGSSNPRIPQRRSRK